jgi:hypothetical protein
VIMKWVVSMPKVEKGSLRVTVLGFHKMANPPDAPVESVCMDSHPCQLLWNMISASGPAHFVSCSSRMSGFSARIESRRILCLDLPLSPLMFQVMIFIIRFVGLGGGIPPRAFGSAQN